MLSAQNLELDLAIGVEEELLKIFRNVDAASKALEDLRQESKDCISRAQDEVKFQDQHDAATLAEAVRMQSQEEDNLQTTQGWAEAHKAHEGAKAREVCMAMIRQQEEARKQFVESHRTRMRLLEAAQAEQASDESAAAAAEQEQEVQLQAARLAVEHAAEESESRQQYTEAEEIHTRATVLLEMDAVTADAQESCQKLTEMMFAHKAANEQQVIEAEVHAAAAKAQMQDVVLETKYSSQALVVRTQAAAAEAKVASDEESVSAQRLTRISDEAKRASEAALEAELETVIDEVEAEETIVAVYAEAAELIRFEEGIAEAAKQLALDEERRAAVLNEAFTAKEFAAQQHFDNESLAVTEKVHAAWKKESQLNGQMQQMFGYVEKLQQRLLRGIEAFKDGGDSNAQMRGYSACAQCGKIFSHSDSAEEDCTS